jgi:hypothetical protein
VFWGGCADGRAPASHPGRQQRQCLAQLIAGAAEHLAADLRGLHPSIYVLSFALLGNVRSMRAWGGSRRECEEASAVP